MPVCRVKKSSHDRPSKDADYVIHVERPLKRLVRKLSYQGYRRIIELYGSEAQFHRQCFQVGMLFDSWTREHPDQHQRYRQQVTNEGLDWFTGRVDGKTGVYLSQSGHTPLDQPLDLASAVRSCPKSPVQPANTIHEGEEMRDTQTSSGQESQHQHTTGQLTSSTPFQSTSSQSQRTFPSPYVVDPVIPPCAANLEGNILPIQGQDSQNLVGAWGLLHVALCLIDKTTDALRGDRTMTIDLIQEIDAFRDLLGGQEGVVARYYGLIEHGLSNPQGSLSETDHRNEEADNATPQVDNSLDTEHVFDPGTLFLEDSAVTDFPSNEARSTIDPAELMIVD